jgi:hypothetical protein
METVKSVESTLSVENLGDKFSCQVCNLETRKLTGEQYCDIFAQRKNFVASETAIARQQLCKHITLDKPSLSSVHMQQ